MEGGYLKRWKALLTDALNLVIPSACLVCGARIDEQSQVICEICEAKIALISSGVCPVCGSEIKDWPCEICLEEAFAFDSARSLFRFNGTIKDLIHALKYNGYESPAGYFALPMAELIESEPALQEHDYICAVPLHRVRKRERGYNQSELIARSVAYLADLPYETPVSRKVNTLSQTLLSKARRVKNLSGAFKVKNPNLVSGKKIILVDDVFTTGSTLNEIAKLLRSAGAKQITAITVARA